MSAILFALAGLVGLVALFATTGVAPVRQAVEAAGWNGLLLLTVYQFLLTVPLALAWRTVCADTPLLPVAWARLVREAASACLPFTAVGGLLIGARVLAEQTRIGWARAGAATAADVTLEFVAQIAFVILGAAILLLRQPHTPLGPPLIAAILLATLAAATLLALQGRAFRAMAARIGLSRIAGVGDASTLGEALDAIHAAPRRLAAGAALHLLAWVLSGLITWEAFRLLGAHIDIEAALAIEALLSFARACAFFVPAGLGVQEAVYVGLGGVYGVGAGVSLGVSLLRRGRELAIGVPVLLLWQAGAMRRIFPRALADG